MRTSILEKHRIFAICSAVLCLCAITEACSERPERPEEAQQLPPSRAEAEPRSSTTTDSGGITPGIDPWPMIEKTWKPLTGNTPTFSTDWIAGKTVNWENYLGKLKNQPNARGLEIGCFEGRSTIWYAQNILTGNGATLTCVDPFSPRLHHFFDHNIDVTGVKDRIVKLTGYSEDVLRTLPTEKKFDFIYVDGGHMPWNTLTDIVFAWDLLKVGGVLIIDDYTYKSDTGENPKPACDAFLEIYKPLIADVLIGTQVIVRKAKEWK